MKDQIGEWGGGEELTRSETWGRCSHNYTHASQRYLQTGYNRCRCSWRQNFRRQRMLPSSDEVHNVGISWNYILLSATYNFGLGKGAKIERNDSKPLCVKTLLVDWGVYTCSEHSESVKQYARIVWASLISSLEVARYDCLPHRFSPTFQPPLFSVENWKKK